MTTSVLKVVIPKNTRHCSKGSWWRNPILSRLVKPQDLGLFVMVTDSRLGVSMAKVAKVDL